MSVCHNDLRVVGARFAGRAAIPLIVIIMNLTEPVVDDTIHVHMAAGCRPDPVVLSKHVEPDIMAVKRYVTVLVNTPVRPLLCQRRQLRVPSLQSFHIDKPTAQQMSKTHNGS